MEKDKKVTILQRFIYRLPYLLPISVVDRCFYHVLNLTAVDGETPSNTMLWTRVKRWEDLKDGRMVRKWGSVVVRGKGE